MTSKAVLIAVVCLLSVTQAQDLWGGESERSRAEVYALEGLGALGGALCCSSCGGSALLVAASLLEGRDFHDAIGLAAPAYFAAAVAAAVLPAATAYGTIKVGAKLGEGGSRGWTYGGAYAGALVGTGLAMTCPATV